MPLTKRRKERWINALRSGEYKQTTTVLFGKFYNGDPIDPDNVSPCHCAVGVLIADEMGKDFDPYTHEAWDKWIKRFGKKIKFYNRRVSTWDYYRTFGLHQNEADTIMRLNDREHWSFKQIADWIEENIKIK